MGSRDPVASSHVSNYYIWNAAATYRTNQGTYVALRAHGSNYSQLSCITATNPPGIIDGWTVDRGNGGCGSPFVTSTDGTNNMIVWVVGTERRPAITRLRRRYWRCCLCRWRCKRIDGGHALDTALPALQPGDASTSLVTTKSILLSCQLRGLRPLHGLMRPRGLARPRKDRQRANIGPISITVITKKR